MKPRRGETWGSAALAIVTLASVVLVALRPRELPWGHLVTAVAAVVGLAGLLVWIAYDEKAPRPGLPWILGAAAGLVVGLGSATDYFLWFSDSRWWTAGCGLIALGLVALEAWKGGWVGGLRSAGVGHLVATTLLLVVFWWNLGAPEQPAVFEAAGMLDSYKASRDVFFLHWIVDAYLGSVLPRTLVAVGLGWGLGAGLTWAKKRFRWT